MMPIIAAPLIYIYLKGGDESLGAMITANMEDPAARRAQLNEHLVTAHANAEATVARKSLASHFGPSAQQTAAIPTKGTDKNLGFNKF